MPTEREWDAIAAELHWSLRELEIVKLTANGHTRKMAAHVAGIGLSTVQVYLRRAVRKAGVTRLAELLWIVVEMRTHLREKD